MVGKSVQADWRALGEEVWVGVAEWRAAHPKATLREIEEVVEEHLARVRARVLADVAMASAARDVAQMAGDERPKCQECGGTVDSRGAQTREVQTLRGDVLAMRRAYAVCQSCGQGFFPPR